MVSPVKREIVFDDLKDLIPPTDSDRQKGQNGKVGVIGGSFEYTGAPFYCAFSALRGGGDLSHIFCTKEAAIPIKSYAPGAIVHPSLISETESGDINDESAITSCVNSITKWYASLHATVIGSGLGRDNLVSQYLEDLFMNLRELITVCDADFFWYLSEKNKESLAEKLRKRSKVTVLTPNKVEFKRIWNFLKGAAKQTPEEDIEKELQSISLSKSNIIEIAIDNPLVKDQTEVSRLFHNINILQKGEVDIITNGKEAYVVKYQGCLKRCGGQGDVLAGLTALYCYWDYQRQNSKGVTIDNEGFNLLKGCILGSYITRYAAAKAYKKYRYGLTTPMILEELPEAINTFVEKGI